MNYIQTTGNQQTKHELQAINTQNMNYKQPTNKTNKTTNGIPHAPAGSVLLLRLPLQPLPLKKNLDH